MASLEYKFESVSGVELIEDTAKQLKLTPYQREKVVGLFNAWVEQLQSARRELSAALLREEELKREIARLSVVLSGAAVDDSHKRDFIRELAKALQPFHAWYDNQKLIDRAYEVANGK